METPSGRNNFRPGCPIIGFSRGGGAEAADDWLEAPEPAERTWAAECRPDGLRQDRALPVRVVSGGPVGGRGPGSGGGGGGGGLSPPRPLVRAFHRPSPVLHRRCLPDAQSSGPALSRAPDSSANFYSSFKTHPWSSLLPSSVCGLRCRIRVLCLISVHTRPSIRLGTE